jgi:hypothetical protein
MALRRRKKSEPEQLDKLLEGYHAAALPSSPASAIATLMCWSCHKPNVYDARRRPPGRCIWCRSVL